MSLQPNEYKCAMCGNVYTKAITDEEAMAETQSHWPGIAQEDCAVLCDDCYQKVCPDEHPQEYRDSLLDAIERTYRAARTDKTTGEILPTHITLKEMLDAYGIPPALLDVGINTNLTASQGYLFTHNLFTERKKS